MMQNRFRWILILVLAGWTLFPVGRVLAAPASLVIKNPDFSQQFEHWSSNRPDDATFAIADGGAMLKMGKEQHCRIYQDIAVTPNTTYRVSYRSKGDAVGSMGRSWVILHGTDSNAWQEKRITYGPFTQKTDWETYSYDFTTMNDTDKVRLNFGPHGSRSGVFFTDVKIDILDQRQAITVPQTQLPVTLDGQLSEPAWAQTKPLDPFRILGKPSEPAKAQTQVKILTQGDALYISFVAEEPNLKGLVAKSQTESMTLHGDDSAQIFITAGGEANYQFIVNPMGLRYVVERGTGKDRQSWCFLAAPVFHREDWHAVTVRGEKSWTMEMRISLKRLLSDAPQGSHTLYALVGRHRPQEDPVYSCAGGMTGETFLDMHQYRAWNLAPSHATLGNSKEALNSVRDLTMTTSWSSPELLIAGKPIHMQVGQAPCRLPSRIVIHCGEFSIAPSLKEFIAKGVQWSEGQGTWDIRCEKWASTPRLDNVTAQETQLLETSNEAFMLNIEPQSITISARNDHGVFRGLATLALLASHAKNNGQRELPSLVILDAPKIPVRGWLVASESPEDIKRHIDILYLLRFNTIMFGASGFGKDSVFPFDSHPHIGRKNSTKAQWAEMADYARSRGINPVPEFYCFSRAGFILNKPQYKHLAENPDSPYGVYVKADHNKNFCSSKPETYTLIFDLMQELIDTMKLTDLQIGQDEVTYDVLNTCPQCVADRVTRSDWIIRTAVKSYEFLHPQNIRMWMYADCLDPEMNGKTFELSGKEMLAKLPQGIIMQDWKYNGLTYPSFQLFAASGFRTIGSPWFHPWNVVGTARDIAALAKNGYGYVGTSWSGTSPSIVLPELVSAQSLGAYASWSPIPDASAIPFNPSILYQAATYHYGKTNASPKAQTSLTPPPGGLSGTDLAVAMGFRANDRLSFLKTPITTRRGVTVVPFLSQGQPAGWVIKGQSQASVHVPIQGKVSRMTLLYAENRQVFEDKFAGEIGAMKKEYVGVVPASYVWHYTDGTSCRLSLVQRRTVNAWNDRFQAAECETGYFGTAGQSYHINIPMLTWVNPYPEKDVKSLELVPGNRKDMDVVLLGATIEH